MSVNFHILSSWHITDFIWGFILKLLTQVPNTHPPTVIMNRYPPYRTHSTYLFIPLMVGKVTLMVVGDFHSSPPTMPLTPKPPTASAAESAVPTETVDDGPEDDEDDGIELYAE